jgi:hypothetical protein
LIQDQGISAVFAMLCHLFAMMVGLQSKLEVGEGVGAQAGPCAHRVRSPIRRVCCCCRLMRLTLFLLASAIKHTINSAMTSQQSQGLSTGNSAEDLAHHGDVTPGPLSLASAFKGEDFADRK